MAPPVNRRTGYSRRAQYSTFLAYVAGVGGALAGGYFLLTALANHAAYGWVRGAASDVVAPVGRLGSTIRHGADTTFDTISGYATWGSENAALKREVALARVREVETAATRDENRRLKALLGLEHAQPSGGAANVGTANAGPAPIANAWLIASTGTSLRRYATISAGSAAGVQPGMPVRAPEGLVGRVLEVGRLSSRVLLLSDAESVVPVRSAKGGIPAFANGRGDGTLQIRLLTLGINPLKPGDAFVTSGSGGLYWPGTPIAVVSEVTRDGAIARVLSDPAASEMVEVQPAWNPTEDPSLPPPASTVPPPPPPKGKGHHGAKTRDAATPHGGNAALDPHNAKSATPGVHR